MSLRRTLHDLSPSFSWAIFLVGVTQISLIFLAPLHMFFTLIGASLLCAIFAIRFPKTKNSPKAMSVFLTYTALLLAAGNVLFNFLIMITWSNAVIFSHAISAFIFLTFGILFSAILSKIFHVA